VPDCILNKNIVQANGACTLYNDMSKPRDTTKSTFQPKMHIEPFLMCHYYITNSEEFKINSQVNATFNNDRTVGCQQLACKHVDTLVIL